MEWMDVLVVGGGPAGSALAGACARRGLATGLLAPAPERPWTATYGMWAAELPVDLPESVVAAHIP
jgi:lycopene beta-cyclase